MSDQRKMLTLSNKQVASIHEARDTRVAIWSGSVRSGKTISAAFAFIDALPEASTSGRVIIAGKTLQTIERNVIDPMQDPNVFGELAAHTTHTRGSGVAKVCGRTVELIGANDARAEEKLRGVTASLAMIDEVTLVPESFYTQMLARLSLDGARLIGTTNPDSRAHWLKRNYLDRADVLNLRHWHFLMRDNPTLSESYIRDIEKEYTGLWYRRFILGEWVSAEDAVYDMWDDTTMVVPHDQLPDMRSYIALGIDFGTTNPTAGTLLALGTDDVMYIVDEWAPRTGLTNSRFADELGRWQDARPKPDWTFVDPAAASFSTELFERDWDGLTHASNAVVDGIRTIASLLDTGRLKVSDRCQNLIDEFSGYRWDDKASAKGEDKPIKENDHFLDSCRYAVFSSYNEWYPIIHAAQEAHP